MYLNINGKDHDLVMNFGFVNKMDKEFKVEQNGMNMGMGVGVGKSLLEETYSLNMLVTIIRAATENTNHKEIEVAIEQYAEEQGDITPLYTELLEQMGKSKLLKPMIKKFEERAAKEQEKLRRQAKENR